MWTNHLHNGNLDLLAHGCFAIHSAGAACFIQTGTDRSCLAHSWPERTPEYLNSPDSRRKSVRILNIFVEMRHGRRQFFPALPGADCQLDIFSKIMLCAALVGINQILWDTLGFFYFLLCDIGIAHHARLTAELPWKQISQPHSDSMFWGLLRNLFCATPCNQVLTSLR